MPQFERRFKELLNENTIREVANFQSQLSRERETIRERVATINRSLHSIDYNPGAFFIALEAQHSVDIEVREFQQDLRACTEGSLTGSEEDPVLGSQVSSGAANHRTLSRTRRQYGERPARFGPAR